MAGDGFFDVRERLTSKVKPAQSSAATSKSAVEILSVSQLTNRIDKAIRAGFPASVTVKGEVSNFNLHRGSGHFYFTLKEGTTACIDCVMFKSDVAQMKFTPTDGMELLVTGRIAIYPQRGRYQLYATSLQPMGQGALELAFRQLHARLEAEGLFQTSRKRPLPPFARRIALVTSRQTAALQDMLKVFRDYPWLKLFLYHVPVQGDGCGQKIAMAIEQLSRGHRGIGGVDLIILARGGGSLEDLWGFNEECLARAIFASTLPIVTGIGHQVDTSIADLVADYHAHTPTEAAQVIVARWKGARDGAEMSQTRLRRGLCTMLADARQRLRGIGRHEAFRRPLDQIRNLRQATDDRQRTLRLALAHRLQEARRRLREMETRLQSHAPTLVLGRMRERLRQADRSLAHGIELRLRQVGENLSRAMTLLQSCHPRHKLRLHRERLAALDSQLRRGMRALHRHQSTQLDGIRTHLVAIGPEQILKRGFSITSIKRSGATVRSVSQIKGGERIVTRFADGTVESVADDPNQPRLFE